jgi:hypothetical protein
MNRGLLPFAMLVSLWPVGFIALSLATASAGSNSDSTNVGVTVPSESPAPAATPKTTTVPLKVGGKTYQCPRGTRKKLNPIDQRLGAVKLKLTSVRRELRHAVRRVKELDKLYPGKNAPTQAIVDEYNGLLRTGRRLESREGRLVTAYNDAVHEANSILESDCY